VLERWREDGTAPDRILAAHVTNGQVDMTRPLCPYPQVAVYKGSGSTNDAGIFHATCGKRLGEVAGLRGLEVSTRCQNRSLDRTWPGVPEILEANWRHSALAAVDRVFLTFATMADASGNRISSAASPGLPGWTLETVMCVGPSVV
jgi:hypothetical protein